MWTRKFERELVFNLKELFFYILRLNNQCTTTIKNVRRIFFNQRKDTKVKIEQLKKYKTKMMEVQREKKKTKRISFTVSQIFSCKITWKKSIN